MEDVQEDEIPDVVSSDGANRTTIAVSKAPEHKREKFERFRAYNTGFWNGPKRENTEAFRRQDRLHLFDSIATSVDLTGPQKKRGRKLVEKIDFNSLTANNIDQSCVIFALCVVVANRDVPDGTRYWPHEDATDDREFRSTGESLGIGLNQQMSLVKKVQSRI